MFSQGPTDKAKITSTDFECELIGENELGSVYIHGPFGNINSNVKIAYLIGMHPLESKSHRALFENLTSSKKLNYCYYIYNIDISNPSSKTEGRMEGQLLAKDFVTPHIINANYDLFIDIHSNRGSNGPGDYDITNFVFAPGFDQNSLKYVDEIVENIEDINFYVPQHRTSPPFITELTSNEGIPTIVYECYSYEPLNVTYDLADKLISCVDSLKI